VDDAGKSFWIYGQSAMDSPRDIQQRCRVLAENGREAFCVFIEPSSSGGAQMTKSRNPAVQYSSDQNLWQDIPSGILATGRMPTSAMVFDEIRFDNETRLMGVNLWDYRLFQSPGAAVIFGQGRSTKCCELGSSTDDPMKLISNLRYAVALARLTEPYAVWVR